MPPRVWSSRALKRWTLSTVKPWTRQKSYLLFIIMWKSVYKGKADIAGKGMIGLPLLFCQLMVSYGGRSWSIFVIFNESSRTQSSEMNTFELEFWILLFSGNTFIKCIAECPTSFSSRSMIRLVCDSQFSSQTGHIIFFNSVPLREFLDLTKDSRFYFQELCVKYISVKWLIF